MIHSTHQDQPDLEFAREAVGDKDWPAFLQLVKTGSVNDEAFLERLDSDETLQDAVDKAFDQQVKMVAGYTEALRGQDAARSNAGAVFRNFDLPVLGRIALVGFMLLAIVFGIEAFRQWSMLASLQNSLNESRGLHAALVVVNSKKPHSDPDRLRLIDQLRPLIGDRDAAVHELAFDAMVRLDPKETIHSLKNLKYDVAQYAPKIFDIVKNPLEDTAIRTAAFEAYQDITPIDGNRDQLFGQIKPLLSDGNASIRGLAYDALVILDPKSTFNQLESLENKVEFAPKVFAFGKNPEADWKIRPVAFKVYHEIASPSEALQTWTIGLRSGDELTKHHCKLGLGKLIREGGVPEMSFALRVLTAAAKWMRDNPAVAAKWFHDNPELVKALDDILRESGSSARAFTPIYVELMETKKLDKMKGYEFLRSVGGKESINYLVDNLAESDNKGEWVVNHQAVRTLVHIGRPAIKQLGVAAKSNNATMRYGARLAITKIQEMKAADAYRGKAP